MKFTQLIVMLCALVAACLHPDRAHAISADEALQEQRADALPPTPLYKVTKPLPEGLPGTLLGSEPGDGYRLPGGVRAVRILYLSRNAADKPVVTSGVVLVPYGRPPAGGWPVIAWAHGTAGVARNCAPSLMKDVYYGWEGLFGYVMLGYAVVATDYAGLGTEGGRHQYMSLMAQARDVINALPAAHTAVPELGSRWVAVGHSQGGATVLKVSQLEHDLRDNGFLGSVSLAPPTDLYKMWHQFTEGYSEAAGYLDIIALGIQAADPSFDPTRMLGPGALAILPKVADEACVDAASVLLTGKPAAALLKPHWADDPAVVRFARTNSPDASPAKGPILLLQGTADRTIPESLTREAAAHLCKRGDQVQYQTYAGIDHDPLVDASFRDQIAWIAARFAGQPAPATCH